MKQIDLRSDTVTHPSAAMRKAMYEAEVGDDVYGEDPTVNQLETLAAQRLDKEAGLFVASGHMGNLVALLTHCGRGAQVVLGSQCHIFHYEQGGAAALGGIHARPIENRADGTLDARQIENAIDPDYMIQRLKEEGVLVGMAGSQIRAVTHYGVTRQNIDVALAAFQKVLGADIAAGALKQPVRLSG